MWLAAGILIPVLLVTIAVSLNNRRQVVRSIKSANPTLLQSGGQDPVTRIRFGKHENPYIDAAGQTWAAEKY